MKASEIFPFGGTLSRLLAHCERVATNVCCAVNADRILAGRVQRLASLSARGRDVLQHR